MERTGLAPGRRSAETGFLSHREKWCEKEMVENGKKAEYTVGSMNARLANWYCWYRFTWHPSGWRGAIL
jgi:hypothetical protein